MLLIYTDILVLRPIHDKYITKLCLILVGRDM